MKTSFELEIDILLDTILRTQGVDLRNIPRENLSAKIKLVIAAAGVQHVAELLPKIMLDPAFAKNLCAELSGSVPSAQKANAPSGGKAGNAEKVTYVEDDEEDAEIDFGSPSKAEVAATLPQGIEQSTMEFPAITDEWLADEASKKANREAVEGKKILLVDDDARNIFALSRALQKHGFTIITAENGKVAVETLEKQNDIALVVMDIMMPIMNGYEAMKTIRSKEKWEELPIIALTANAMRDEREKCMDAGATDYMMKPVNVDQLVTLLQGWLIDI